VLQSRSNWELRLETEEDTALLTNCFGIELCEQHTLLTGGYCDKNGEVIIRIFVIMENDPPNGFSPATLCTPDGVTNSKS